MSTSDLIRQGLAEDIGSGDITSQAVVPSDLKGRGEIRAKERLILAGIDVAAEVFSSLDSALLVTPLAKDGNRIEIGQSVLSVEGSYRSILGGERVALNFLARLCGIATLTSEYVKAVGKGKTKILDTRKTLPLYRELEKYAVGMGGGENHRKGLFDEILIKENHLAACAGSVGEAVAHARKAQPKVRLVVEITQPKEVEPAIEHGADRLLLDNMSNSEIETCMVAVQGRVPVEVSGGIARERVSALAQIGVDYISVGALTHSARAIDLSMEIQPR